MWLRIAQWRRLRKSARGSSVRGPLRRAEEALSTKRMRRHGAGCFRCQWQPHGATKNHGLRTSNQGHGNGRSGHGSAAAAPGRLSVSVFSPYRFPSSSGPTQGSCQQHHPPPTRQQQGTTTAPSNPGACVGDLKPPQPLPHTHTSSAQHEVPSPQADSLPRPPTPRCSCRSPCRSSSRASS